MTKPTTKSPADKPTKPYADSPLFPHATGRWAKKIKGRLHYFGPWRDWQVALQRFLDTKDDLYAGRTPRPKTDGLTIRDLLNYFLTSRTRLRDADSLTSRSLDDYFASCERMKSFCGPDRAAISSRDPPPGYSGLSRKKVALPPRVKPNRRY